MYRKLTSTTRAVRAAVSAALFDAAAIFRAALQESAVADAVRADQRHDRDTPLGESSGVFHGGGRGVDQVGRAAVLEDVQQGGDVLLHTGIEELLDGVVPS